MTAKISHRLQTSYLVERLRKRFLKVSATTPDPATIRIEIDCAVRAAGVTLMPRDLEKLARKLQVPVLEEPLDCRGRIVLEAGQLVIEINHRLSAFEKRKTLAHELGHLILDKEGITRAYLQGGHRGRISRLEYDAIEKSCDVAADELLLPERWLENQLPRDPSLESLLKTAAGSGCDLDFVATRVLDLGHWTGCHFLWWKRAGDRMVVSRSLPAEDDAALAFYESVGSDSLPWRALTEKCLVRGRLRIHNGIVNKDVAAECIPVSHETALSFFW